MVTLASIEKQIAVLQRKADAMRKAEAAAAAAQVKALIAQHGLSAHDLGLSGAPRQAGAKLPLAAARRPSSAPRLAGVPKYQDPKSGKTWTGVGKPPAWIAGAKSRDKFLIAVAVTPAAEKGAAATTVKQAKTRTAKAVAAQPVAAKTVSIRKTKSAAKGATDPASAGPASANLDTRA